MTDHRDVLERGLREFRAPKLPYEAILQRRDRHRRNQRIAAGVVGLAIGIAAILVGARAFQADRTTPANPEPPLKHNGVIAFPDGDTLTLFDPRTGISSSLSLRTGRGGYNVGELTWSPDGSKLAYWTGQPIRGTVRVLDLETRKISTVVPCRIPFETETHAVGNFPRCESLNLAWSPDGSRIALSGAEGLDLIDPDGSNRTTLIGRGYIGPATWSPDGATIAFTARYADWDRHAVYEVDADGSDLRVLFEQPGSAPPWDLRWSPDGSRIAYFVAVPNPDPDGYTEPLHSILPQVWIVDADGSRPSKLFEGGACCAGGGWGGTPSWSPDGTKIAVIARPPGSAYGSKVQTWLYVLDPDTGGAQKLARDVTALGPPAWQPIP
jgi:Tol biopolymer transport system component